MPGRADADRQQDSVAVGNQLRQGRAAESFGPGPRLNSDAERRRRRNIGVDRRQRPLGRISGGETFQWALYGLEQKCRGAIAGANPGEHLLDVLEMNHKIT